RTARSTLFPYTTLFRSGTAFADHDRNGRYLQRKAGRGRTGNGFRLAAFLGADSRIGAGRVNKRDDGNREAVGQLHQPYGLAITFRPDGAEIVLEPACRVGSLLLADDRDRLAVEACKAADDRLVVAKLAVAGQRCEVGEQSLDVVEAMGPVRMARDLHLLPWRQGLVDVAKRIARALFQSCDLVGDIDGLAT